MLTLLRTIYVPSSELVCVAHNPLLQFFRSRSTANELRRQATEHFGSHASMSSNGAAALHTMPRHRPPAAVSVEAAGELVEQRVLVSRIATHSSCGVCTVHVVSYASAAELCTELLVTLLPC